MHSGTGYLNSKYTYHLTNNSGNLSGETVSQVRESSSTRQQEVFTGEYGGVGTQKGGKNRPWGPGGVREEDLADFRKEGLGVGQPGKTGGRQSKRGREDRGTAQRTLCRWRPEQCPEDVAAMDVGTGQGQ